MATNLEPLETKGGIKKKRGGESCRQEDAHYGEMKMVPGGEAEGGGSSQMALEKKKEAEGASLSLFQVSFFPLNR